MERGGNLVPIGRFSQICRLTVKALRHYDDLGLLKPALVDPQSGYRYYTIEQAATAEMIRTLRAVEMSLDEIGAALGTADRKALRDALTRHRDRLQARIADQQNAVALVERLLTREEHPVSYTIDLVEVPAQHTVGMRLTTPPSELGRAIPRAHSALTAQLAARAVAFAGPPIVVYHAVTPEEEAMDIEVGWPIAEAIAADGDLRPGTIGGGLAAHTTHLGPYDQLSAAWSALGAWVQSHGHETNGAPWESYASAPNEPPDPAEYRTDIYWPIR